MVAIYTTHWSMIEIAEFHEIEISFKFHL